MENLKTCAAAIPAEAYQVTILVLALVLATVLLIQPWKADKA